MNRRSLLLGVVLAAGASGPPAKVITRAAPPILSCETWDACPPAEPPVVIALPPARILVHHTATENTNDFSVRHAHWLGRYFQGQHIERGWGDTGQHFTNSRGGVLIEGRHLSLASLIGGRRMVQGAHCPGQNMVSIGIENEGTYMDAEPPLQQWMSLVSFCAYTCRQYDIPPSEIYGHRDFLDGTLCPGDALYARLPQLRRAVAQFIG